MKNNDSMSSESGKRLTADQYKYVLDQVVPSGEMRAYLLQASAPFLKHGVPAIVNNAPVSLQTKLAVYKRLSATDDFSYFPSELTAEGSLNYKSIWPFSDVNGLPSYIKRELMRDYFSFDAAFVEYALDALNLHPGEYLQLTSKEYDHDILHDKETKLAKFSDSGSAGKFISDYVRSQPDDKMYWLQLDLCKSNTNEKCFTYYLKKDQIVWFQRYGSTLYKHVFFDLVSCVSLPVPFKTGTIVSIDCRPFAPLTYAVILVNNWALYRDDIGNWIIDDIRTFHPLRFHKTPIYSTEFSPLYNLSSLHGELPEEYSFFTEISRTLYRKRHLAEEFYHAFSKEWETKYKQSYVLWQLKNMDTLRKHIDKEEHFRYPGLNDNEFRKVWNSFT